MHLPLERAPVYARQGMVATSQPLAAQVGLFVLREGGSAADAAIATAAALTVLEPTSNGLGGDCFAIVHEGGELHGLNASGRAPAAASLEALPDGHMPTFGWLPVTVPGQVEGWRALHERFGRLPFARLMAPAAEYARRGVPLSPEVARHWGRAAERYAQVAGEHPETGHWHETFMPQGFTPRPGAVWVSEAHAGTLERLGKEGPGDFYKGGLAERMVNYAQESGGLLREADLAAHAAEWVQPIGARWGEFELFELPPNGQGVAALVALNVLRGLPEGDGAAEALHWQVEAMKQGFAQAHRFVADPEHAEVDVAGMLSEERAAELREPLGKRAFDPGTRSPSAGGTVYLCTADASGQMVSFIQSNYMGFGSGVVVPGTGIGLHNRGHNFNLEAGHPNALAPGKRPYHTIIPGFLNRGGRALGPMGVMGGFMQPQGHLQVLLHLAGGKNPQQALDAPRWQVHRGLELELEAGFGPELARQLAAKGHAVRLGYQPASFGRGQIILREGDVYVGGSEPRADGQVAAY